MFYSKFTFRLPWQFRLGLKSCPFWEYLKFSEISGEAVRKVCNSNFFRDFSKNFGIGLEFMFFRDHNNFCKKKEMEIVRIL